MRLSIDLTIVNSMQVSTQVARTPFVHSLTRSVKMYAHACVLAGRMRQCQPIASRLQGPDCEIGCACWPGICSWNDYETWSEISSETLSEI